MSYATWEQLLREACEFQGEDFDSLVTTLSKQEMRRSFDRGFGGAEGVPFTAWSPTRVYFPTEYDGAEGVRSVPRNPCDEETEHV